MKYPGYWKQGQPLTAGEQNKKSNQPLTLVIDQGTLSTRALALNENGKVLTSASYDVSLQSRGLELVEQDANEILASVHEVVQTVL
ncbi:MAG: FGGY family carbohydrate kinase, partial [Syntrophobacterales bacterium]